MPREAFEVTARKLRPQRFEDVVAQEHIVKTLQNAVRADRVAHAYLFSGPRGTGKTTTARLLAKALNCENGPTPDPCGECAYCRAIADGKSMDVLEIDGASNRGIDEIRQLREEVGYAASKGKRRVYIIDEVHMLTDPAFNALLKTLEEPPSHVVFVFATTASHKVPETILSRCQRYNFRRIPTGDIASHLRKTDEGKQAEEEALFMIARRADGAMRDAQGLLDQVTSFCDGGVTADAVRDMLGIIPRDVYFELLHAVQEGDGRNALDLVGRVVDEGGDVGEFIDGLLEHLRLLMVSCVSGGLKEEDIAEADQARFLDVSKEFKEDDLLRMLQIVSDLELNLGRVSNPRFWLELTVMKLVKMTSTISVEEVMAKLDRLEAELKGRTGQPTAKRIRSTEPPPHLSEAKPPAEDPGPPAAPPERVEDARTPEGASTSEPDVSRSNAQEGNVTLEGIQSGWDGLVDAVKAQKISVGTFLTEGKPRAFDGLKMTLAFPHSSAFHANQVTRNREMVEGAATAYYGAEIRIACEVVDEGGGDGPREEAYDPETDEDVQMALKILDGEIVRS